MFFLIFSGRTSSLDRVQEDLTELRSVREPQRLAFEADASVFAIIQSGLLLCSPDVSSSVLPPGGEAPKELGEGDGVPLISPFYAHDITPKAVPIEVRIVINV